MGTDESAVLPETKFRADYRASSPKTPEDEVRRVLRYELDLAILEKWREIAAIEEEIERGREVLSLLERLLVAEAMHSPEIANRAMGPLGLSGAASPASRATPRASRSSTTLVIRRPAVCLTPPAPAFSRFLVARPVLVGNVAKLVSPESVGSAQPTHRWRLYVRSPGPDGSDAALASWVRGVRFRLHPSYAPDDVVTLARPPFEVSRFGWADFPARVEILLRDLARNPRPAEIVHHVRVSDVFSPRYVVSAEAVHHVCIHRRSGMPRLSSSRPAPAGTDQQQADGEETPRRRRRTYSSIRSDCTIMDAFARDYALLSLVVGDFPLVGHRGPRAEATATLVPSYVPVTSRDEWLQLTPAQRTAAETHRAEAIVGHIATVFPDAPFAMDAAAVATWLHTPLGARATNGMPLAGGETVRFCWFCGLPHSPQDRFETLQRNCTMRPRKVHINSRTSAGPLLAAAESRIVADHSAFSRPVIVRQTPEDGPATRIVAGDALDTWVADALAPIAPSIPQISGTTIPVISAALRLFLGHFVPACVSEIPSPTPNGRRQSRLDAEDISATAAYDPSGAQPPSAAITPMHILRAILSRPEFDFLSNAHMLGARPPSTAPGEESLSAL